MQTFQSSCTIPPSHAFVVAPNTRGTLDIVWSCFGVIILCTWSILIIHIPEQLGKVYDDKSKFTAALRGFGRVCFPGLMKFAWMMFTIVVPEFVLGKALSGFIRARDVEKLKRSIITKDSRIRSLYEEQLEGWTTAHSMLADHGGFIVDFRSLTSHPPHNGVGASSTPDENIIPEEPVEQNLFGRKKAAVSSTSLDVERELVDAAFIVSPSEDLATGLSIQPHGSLNSAFQSKQSREEKHSPADEISIRIGDEDDSIPLPTRTILDPGLSASLTSFPEDVLLTNFIKSIEQSLSSIGGFDWQPHADHRRLINQLAAEGHMPERPSKEFNEWHKSPFYVLCGDRWVLNAKQILLAAERGLIALPSIPLSEIQDKSKINGLIILLALFQISQLGAALINRGAQGKAISQLETVRLAYAVCGITTYILQWSCPKDVGIPIVAQALRPASKRDVLLVSEHGKARWWWGGMLQSYTIPYLWTPNHSLSHDVGTLLALAAFGACHLVAWGFDFPTSGERLMWRLSGLAIMVIPVAILIVMALLLWLVSDERTESDSWNDILLWFSLWPLTLTTIVFALARLFLIMEAFRSLYFLPPTAYIATWTRNMPGLE